MAMGPGRKWGPGGRVGRGPKAFRKDLEWQSVAPTAITVPLPTSEWQIADPPVQPDRTWTLNLVLTTLATPAIVVPVIEWQLPDPLPWVGQWWTQNPATLRVGAALPPGEQIYDLTPRDHQRPQDLRTWTWSYNQNLIGKDQLPPGVQPGEPVTDLPPRAYPEPATRSWLWSYNLNLIGQDRLPVGEQNTDLPPRDYQRPQDLRTWTWQYNKNLIAQDAMVTGEQITDLPPRAYPEPATRTWAWSFNLNLISKDRMTVGEQVTDLPPRAYPEPATRTWVWTYNLNLIGKDAMAVGEQVTDLPPRAYPEPATRTWLWSYNLNLIGKDQLPVGAELTDLPPRDYSRILQTWVAPLSLPLTTVVQPLPFNQYSWPTPQPLTQPDRGFTAFYNVNLIGKDVLPTGARLTDLPPRDFQRTLQTWITNVSLALTAQAQPFSQLDWPNPRPVTQPDRGFASFFSPTLIGQDALPVGARVTDLPPRDYPPPATRTWTFSYSLDLIGQDRFPPGARVFELAPVGPPHPTQNRTWTWAYNQNLIGQDALPVGARLSDLPPRDHVRLLQTWVQTVNLALAVPTGAPFSQFDWPLPRPLVQPDRSFIATFPLTLIGQDRLPVGHIITDLPPTGYVYPNQARTFTATFPAYLIGQDVLPIRQMDWPLPTIAAQPDRAFSATYNRNLIGQDAFPPGARVTDLPPTGYQYPTSLRFFSQSPAVPPPTPPPSTGALNAPQFFVTTGQSIGSPAQIPS